MENVIEAPNYSEKGHFVFDTTIVLFFLAMDLGGSMELFGFDSVISILTIVAFMVLPYFLPFAGEKPEFAGWIVGRLFVAVIAVISGMGVQTISEVFLMENIKFLPLTLLIISGILCAATQIRGIIKVRLAS